jgi:hypothetical protein
MRNWKILLLFSVAAIIFVLALIFGPTKTGKEPAARDIGLALFAIFGLCAYGYELSFKYTHRMYTIGYSWTLHQENDIGKITISDKEGKPQVFCIHRLGGCRLIPVGGPTHGVMIAREDLIYVDKGDYTNIMVRSIPDVYRTNHVADDYEKPLNQLPGEFLAALQQRGLVKNGLPVYVAWDPIEPLNVNDAVSKDGIPFKSLYDQKCQEVNYLSAIAKNLGSTSSNISKASKLQSDVFVKRHTPKRSPVLRREMLTPGEEEDDG